MAHTHAYRFSPKREQYFCPPCPPCPPCSPHIATTQDCPKLPFTTIPNGSFDGKYHNSCFWIALCNALNDQAVQFDTPDRIEYPYHIRDAIGFPRTNVQFDTMEHHRFGIMICDMFGISLHIYTVNYSGNFRGGKRTRWIGNAGVIFNPSRGHVTKNDTYAIASFGNHYELIISGTPSTNPICGNPDPHKSGTVSHEQQQVYHCDHFAPESRKHLTVERKHHPIKREDTPSRASIENANSHLRECYNSQCAMRKQLLSLTSSRNCDDECSEILLTMYQENLLTLDKTIQRLIDYIGSHSIVS